jgi:flavodoxin
MRSIHFITASTSGNTEYVARVVQQHLAEHAATIVIEQQRAELAQPADLQRGDLLILGSGTWNTGGTEGQLNMHMDAFLRDTSGGLP